MSAGRGRRVVRLCTSDCGLLRFVVLLATLAASAERFGIKPVAATDRAVEVDLPRTSIAFWAVDHPRDLSGRAGHAHPQAPHRGQTVPVMRTPRTLRPADAPTPAFPPCGSSPPGTVRRRFGADVYVPEALASRPKRERLISSVGPPGRRALASSAGTERTTVFNSVLITDRGGAQVAPARTAGACGRRRAPGCGR